MRDRIAIWIIAALGLLLAPGGAAWMVYENRQVAEARDWPGVEGRIDSARIETRTRRRTGRPDRTRYSPRVEYRYTVGGTTYLNDDIWVASEQSFSSHEGAAAILRDYPVGGTVRVFHSPTDPRRSALRIENDRTVTAILIAVGLFLLGLAWWMHRKARARAMHLGVPSA